MPGICPARHGRGADAVGEAAQIPTGGTPCSLRSAIKKHRELGGHAGCPRGAAALAGLAIPLALAAAASAALTTPAAATSSRPAAATTPRCSAADLEVWVAADQGTGAAGTASYSLEFTNISTHTCTLFGHPGVSAISSSGHQLGSPAIWDNSVAPHTVRLAPAATGYALLDYSDVITENCPPAYKVSAFELRVIPPGQSQSVHAFWPLAACTAPGQTKFLSVRVIAPGIGLRGDTG